MNKTPNQPADYAQSLKHFCAAVLNNEEQVAAYSTNYRGVHICALQNIYLTVQCYLEAKVFSALAFVYVLYYPPSRWDLNIYGEDFPKLLAAQTKSSKDKEADWSLLARIASIEHAISRAYYGYIRGCEQLPAYTQTVSDAEFVSQLQRQHPYIHIADKLDSAQILKIRCTDSKIHISND